MRITIFEGDEREFSGTPRETVDELRAEATFFEGETIAEYIDWVCGNIKRTREIDIKPVGDNDDELCRSFIELLVEHNLAVK